MNFNTKPYNSYLNADGKLVLEVACAGFGENELEVKRSGTQLTVSGKKADKAVEVKEFFNRSLSYRDFADNYIVPIQWELSTAELINGVLRVTFFEDKQTVPITVVKPKKA